MNTNENVKWLNYQARSYLLVVLLTLQKEYRDYSPSKATTVSKSKVSEFLHEIDLCIYPYVIGWLAPPYYALSSLCNSWD